MNKLYRYICTVNLFSLKMQNLCVNNQCSSNSCCQTGFTDRGYRCVCSAEYIQGNIVPKVIYTRYFYYVLNRVFHREIKLISMIFGPHNEEWWNRRRFSCRFENVEDASAKNSFLLKKKGK